jgi:hypothetical protein
LPLSLSEGLSVSDLFASPASTKSGCPGTVHLFAGNYSLAIIHMISTLEYERRV